jgi:hypothetical protein
MSEFLASHPGVPYGELVELLGRDFAVVQLLVTQLDESKKRNELKRAMADSLARHVNEIPNGWTGQRDFLTVSALSGWYASVSTRVSDAGADAYLQRVKSALYEQVQPPVGWRPEGPDDELIRRAFALADGSE